MERILIDKDERGYQDKLNQYKHGLSSLNSIAKKLCDLKVDLSTKKLMMFINGGDLLPEIYEKTTNGVTGVLPKAVRKLVMADLEEDYQIARDEAEAFRSWNDNNGIALSMYTVNEAGTVEFTDQLTATLERSYCVYIDTEYKHQVYSKYQAFIKAYNELREAVKTTPKRELSQMEKGNVHTLLWRTLPQNLDTLPSNYNDHCLLQIDRSTGDIELDPWKFNDFR